MNIVKTVKYRGITITVDSVSTRFGVMYRTQNDYGEPRVGEPQAYKTVAEAVGAEKKDIDQLLEDDDFSREGRAVNNVQLAKSLVALAKELTAVATFKCPECGTKVLENTGYCLSCKKKVKKAMDGITPSLEMKESIDRAIRDLNGTQRFLRIRNLIMDPVAVQNLIEEAKKVEEAASDFATHLEMQVEENG